MDAWSCGAHSWDKGVCGKQLPCSLPGSKNDLRVSAGYARRLAIDYDQIRRSLVSNVRKQRRHPDPALACEGSVFIAGWSGLPNAIEALDLKEGQDATRSLLRGLFLFCTL